MALLTDMKTAAWRSGQTSLNYATPIYLAYQLGLDLILHPWTKCLNILPLSAMAAVFFHTYRTNPLRYLYSSLTGILTSYALILTQVRFQPPEFYRRQPTFWENMRKNPAGLPYHFLASLSYFSPISLNCQGKAYFTSPDQLVRETAPMMLTAIAGGAIIGGTAPLRVRAYQKIQGFLRS